MVFAACGGDDDSSDVDDTAQEAPTDTADDDTDDTTVDDTTDDDTTDTTDTTVDDTTDDDTTDTTIDDTTDEIVTAALGEDCVGPTGGTITVAVPSVSTTLDPLTASGGLGGDLIHIYDVLFAYDAETGEYVPRLAESVTPNDDATVWTVVLRDDVTFGNGDPMDAAAVKASMDRHLTEGSTSVLVAYQALIADVAVVDDVTLEFTLTGPWGAFPFGLTRGLGYITNVDVIDEVGAETFATDPTGGGAGPFEVTRFSPPESIEFTAKDGWWGGELCVDRVVYEVIPDASTANEAYRNNEIDVALVDARSPIASAEAKDLSDNVATFIQHGGGVLMLNAGRGEQPPITADPRIRAAIAAAIDPAMVDERAFDGVGFPQNSLIQEASRVYEPLDGPPYDPDLASELVEEVKAETGWDGTLRFDCVTNLADAALSMGAMLGAVGFELQLEPNRTLPQQIELVIAGNFDIACFGHTPDEADLWDGLRPYASDNPRNLSGIASPEIDAALEVLRGATTTDEVQEAMEQVQAAWNEENPAVVYAAFEHVLIWDDAVDGVGQNYSVTVVPTFDKASVSR